MCTHWQELVTCINKTEDEPIFDNVSSIIITIPHQASAGVMSITYDIPSVSFDDQGIYTCLAESEDFQASDEVTINVHGNHLIASFGLLD